jgi:signal peptidase II
LAGALGNLIDRLFLGYVVDFFDFRIWPVFNVADSAITIGAILLGWSILKSSKNNPASQAGSKATKSQLD